MAHYNEIYVTVPDCWLKYDASHLLYVTTLPVFTYGSGLYIADEDYRARVFYVSKKENLVTSLTLFLAACKEGEPRTLYDSRSLIATTMALFWFFRWLCLRMLKKSGFSSYLLYAAIVPLNICWC